MLNIAKIFKHFFLMTTGLNELTSMASIVVRIRWFKFVHMKFSGSQIAMPKGVIVLYRFIYSLKQSRTNERKQWHYGVRWASTPVGLLSIRKL